MTIDRMVWDMHSWKQPLFRLFEVETHHHLIDMTDKYYKLVDGVKVAEDLKVHAVPNGKIHISCDKEGLESFEHDEFVCVMGNEAEKTIGNYTMKFIHLSKYIYAAFLLDNRRKVK